MTYERFTNDAEMVDKVINKLNTLEKFPLRLSELEEFMGMPLKRYHQQESYDPTFMHDVGGSGINVGGNPIYHQHWDKDLPSKYYARYQTEPGSKTPPDYGSNPMVDLISVSGRYDQMDPPEAPEGTERFEDESYSYLPNHFMMRALDKAFTPPAITP